VVLTLGKGTYEKHVQQLRRVYATLHNTGKQFERECQEVRTKQEATDCGLRCLEVGGGVSNMAVGWWLTMTLSLLGAQEGRGQQRGDTARGSRNGEGGGIQASKSANNEPLRLTSTCAFDGV